MALVWMSNGIGYTASTFSCVPADHGGFVLQKPAAVLRGIVDHAVVVCEAADRESTRS